MTFLSTKLVLTIGIPGSGKSTWVERYAKEHPEAVVVSTDGIRKEVTGTSECRTWQSRRIHEIARARVRKLMEEGKPLIVVDSTNTELREWREYWLLGARETEGHVFDISAEEGERRQAGRERKVPSYAIHLKYDELQRNKRYMKFFFDTIIYEV